MRENEILLFDRKIKKISGMYSDYILKLVCIGNFITICIAIFLAKFYQSYFPVDPRFFQKMFDPVRDRGKMIAPVNAFWGRQGFLQIEKFRDASRVFNHRP